MTTTEDLDVCPADIGQLEWKALPTGETSSPMTGVIGHDDEEGTVTALVAVSGVCDEVGDVIVPGSLGVAVKRLKPKGVDAHDWKTPVSRADWAVELMPGDDRLPKTTPDGAPWPVNAGGLLIKARYNLNTVAGRDAYENAKFYGPEQSFSIGYKVRPGGARMRGGRRYLSDYDIYEYSQVLHGAHRLAHLTGVKSLQTSRDDSDTWYDDPRSGLATVEGIETKVRTVRDSKFWKLPAGTPIKPGMKPAGETPGRSADIAHTPSAPSPAGSDAPGTAIAHLGERVAELKGTESTPGGLGTVSAIASANMLSQFTRPGASVLASPDSQIAAVNNGKGWVIVDTANGSPLPMLPADSPPDQVEAALTEIAALGIPWDDVTARKARWADKAKKLADQNAVTAIITKHSHAAVIGTALGATPAPQGEAPPDVAQARTDAEGAIGDGNRDELADALTRMGLSTDQDPHDTAAALLVLPTEVAQQRLDKIAGAAHPSLTATQASQSLNKPPAAPNAPAGVTAPPPAGGPLKTPPAAPVTDQAAQAAHSRITSGAPQSNDQATIEQHAGEQAGKPGGGTRADAPHVPTGNMNAPDKLTDDQLEAEHGAAATRHARARQNNLPKTSTEYSDSKMAEKIFGDEKRKRGAVAAVKPGDVIETAKPEDESDPLRPGPGQIAYGKIRDASHPAQRDANLHKLDDTELASVKVAAKRRGGNGANMADSVKTEELHRRLAPAELHARADKMQGGGAFDGMKKRLHERADDYAARDAAGIGRHDFDTLPHGAAVPKKDGGETASDTPTDAIPVPPDVQDRAAEGRDSTLGISEDPDGTIEVTAEVAARQERVEVALEAGEAALAGQTTPELHTTQKDLTDELALQTELQRRDTARKREAATSLKAPAESGRSGVTSDSAGAPAEDTGPKLRPGVAGAAEDLGDLLNAKDSDPDAVKAAADRFVKLLRRTPADSKAFITVRDAIGDDIHGAIASGELKPGMLFAAAGGLREERRVARSAGAKKRRVAKRIERDRIKSPLGSVEAELRSRKNDEKPVVVTGEVAERLGDLTARTDDQLVNLLQFSDVELGTDDSAQLDEAERLVNAEMVRRGVRRPQDLAPGDRFEHAVASHARREKSTVVFAVVQNEPGRNRLVVTSDRSSGSGSFPYHDLPPAVHLAGSASADNAPAPDAYGAHRARMGDVKPGAADRTGPPADRTGPPVDSTERRDARQANATARDAVPTETPKRTPLNEQRTRPGGPTKWDEMRDSAPTVAAQAIAEASDEDLVDALRLIGREKSYAVMSHDSQAGGLRRLDVLRKAVRAEQDRRAGAAPSKRDQANVTARDTTPAALALGDMSMDGLRAERRQLLRDDRTPGETARFRAIGDEILDRDDQAHQQQMASERAQKPIAQAKTGPELRGALGKVSDEELASAAETHRGDRTRTALIKEETQKRAGSGAPSDRDRVNGEAADAHSAIQDAHAAAVAAGKSGDHGALVRALKAMGHADPEERAAAILAAPEARRLGLISLSEEKALADDVVISGFDLLRAQRLGVEIKARSTPSDTPDPEDKPDPDEESYAVTVVANFRYVMDASGVMHKVWPCSECGNDIQVPAGGDVKAPACPSCGSKAGPRGISAATGYQMQPTVATVG